MFRGTATAPGTVCRKAHLHNLSHPSGVRGKRSRGGGGAAALRRLNLSGEAGVPIPPARPAAALTWAGARRAGWRRSLLRGRASGPALPRLPGELAGRKRQSGPRPLAGLAVTQGRAHAIGCGAPHHRPAWGSRAHPLPGSRWSR